MTTLHDIARSFFDANPVAKQDAQHKGLLLLRSELRATHRFGHYDGKTTCWVCGQDWHAKDMPRCRGFKRCDSENVVTKIDRVLVSEHALYLAVVARSETLVRGQHADWSTMTGEVAAVLHHTHGCGREELEWIFGEDMPTSLRADYEAAMDRERARSRAARVEQVITLAP